MALDGLRARLGDRRPREASAHLVGATIDYPRAPERCGVVVGAPLGPKRSEIVSDTLTVSTASRSADSTHRDGDHTAGKSRARRGTRTYRPKAGSERLGHRKCWEC